MIDSSHMAGHVGAAGGARTHDHGDLRDAGGRQPCLVVEDPAEMIAIREHLVLQRQERAARIDEVDAGQAVLERDLLRAQVLLDGDRVVRAALDRRVVGDHEQFAAVDAADAGHQARGRRVVAVQAVGGERRDLEKRAAGIEQGLDALARQQLAARHVLRACGLVAAGRRERLAPLQVGDERRHVRRVRAELGAAGIHARGDARHGAVARSSSRPISMRRISLVPAPISYSLASRRMRPAGYSLM